MSALWTERSLDGTERYVFFALRLALQQLIPGSASRSSGPSLLSDPRIPSSPSSFPRSPVCSATSLCLEEEEEEEHYGLHLSICGESDREHYEHLLVEPRAVCLQTPGSR
ncbi:hypothetical protein NHX12_019521 [Muraenolepis orangiensis]|uniref:Uncharacterized protein n=1 Tax=Muraenolepis orangiensis TaxID=630683 RepID=A0A9Q0IXK2_9TELE|nr:hypothetical protein NHX12_019521 [Muraenolepis orangiensis]